MERGPDEKNRTKSAEESAEKVKGKKPKKKKAKRGEKGKSKYVRYVEPRLSTILAWKRQGLSDEQIADKLHVAYSTFKLYKTQHEELSAVLRAGADDAHACVENAFFNLCCGMTAKVKKPMKVKETVYENGRKVKEIERIEMAEDEVFIPPNAAADMFYLSRRMPERWGAEGKDETEGGGVILIPDAER